MSDPTHYLLGLFVVEQRTEPPVAPGTVAEYLDRSAGTAVAMFHRLDDRGLVAYEPYEGVALTERGRTRGEELHETYVTLSWFFRDVLELDEYEAEAVELAGTLSPDVVGRLAELLAADVEGARPPQNGGE